jgi:hypothetical protein
MGRSLAGREPHQSTGQAMLEEAAFRAARRTRSRRESHYWERSGDWLARDLLHSRHARLIQANIGSAVSIPGNGWLLPAIRRGLQTLPVPVHAQVRA